MNVLHSSESAEWYTPREIVDAARAVMGVIDLDPASCAEANETVQAARYFTQYGLRLSWAGAVWLNPPYGKDDESNRSNQAVWIAKLFDEYRRGNTWQACYLVNAVPGNRWFEPLWQHPICFLSGRVRFVPPAGSGVKNSPTHSSCVGYLGPAVERFAAVFASLGHVVLPSHVVHYEAQAVLL